MLRRYLLLGPLEKEVMEVIWKMGRGVKVREVLNAINSDRQLKYAYTTILTVCQNLEKKGLLRSEKAGKANIYHPTVEREKFYRSRFESLVKGMAKEYPEVAVSFFVESMGIPPDEVERLLKKLEK